MKIFAKLAQKNRSRQPEAYEKYRKQLVKDNIAEEYDYSAEIGMLGEAVENLYNMIGAIHPDIQADESFTSWRKKVSEIKNKIKSNLEEE